MYQITAYHYDDKRNIKKRNDFTATILCEEHNVIDCIKDRIMDTIDTTKLLLFSRQDISLFCRMFNEARNSHDLHLIIEKYLGGKYIRICMDFKIKHYHPATYDNNNIIWKQKISDIS